MAEAVVEAVAAAADQAGAINRQANQATEKNITVLKNNIGLY